MGFLDPDNKSKLDANLGMPGSQSPDPKSPSGLLLTTSLGILSLALIGAAGWFAFQTDLESAPTEQKVVAAAPKPVEDNAFANLQEESIGTSPANRTVQAMIPPTEERRENAHLVLLNQTTGPLEVLTLEEIEQLTSIKRTTPREEKVVAAVTQVQPTVQPAPVEIEEQSTVAPAIDEEPVVVSVATPDVSAAPDPTPTLPPQQIEIAAFCAGDLRKIAANSTIYFDTGSAQLDANGLKLLRTIGTAVEDCPNVIVQVNGHSDSSGSDETNLSLSWQRADNAVAALSALGIDTSRFEPVGFGARVPASQGDSSEPDFDRRIEFMVMESN